MTTKDLNFSLDQSRAQATADRAQTPTGRNTRVEPVLARGMKQNTRRAPKPGSDRQWIVTTGFALANMLFLLLAGIWLSGHTNQFPAQATRAGPAATMELALKLSGLQDQLKTLQLQLANLQQSIEIKQQMLASAHVSIDEQLREVLARPGSEAKSDSTTGGPGPAPEQDWYVNLGNFPDERTAIGLQQHMQDIGHDAQIRSQINSGKTTFLVMLPGFTDRESAEFTAKQIMEQTNLNGLWVWKDEGPGQGKDSEN